MQPYARLCLLVGQLLFMPIIFATSQQLQQSAASTSEAVQLSNAISLLLKPNQASACDGEQLEIKCSENYVIEIITAELSVLAKEHHGQTPANASSVSQPAAGDDTAGGSKFICPPLPEGQSNYTAGGRRACDEEHAYELSTASQAKFLSLVRQHCSLLNACTLDFRLPEEPGEPAANLGAPEALQDLARSLRASCPSNRKLIELAYKCRPSKVKSRTACRHSRLVLECPANEPSKRLVIGSALYGFWNDDKKTHEKCQSEEERLRASAATTLAPPGGHPDQQLASGPVPTSASQLASAKNCSSTSAQPLHVAANECLFKRQCQVQLKPQLLRSSDFPTGTSCPPNQLEYLKVVYVCISEDLLVATNASQLLQAQRHSDAGRTYAPPSPGSRQEAPGDSSGSSAPLAAAGQLATPPPSAQRRPPAELADPTDQRQQQQQQPVTMTILAGDSQQQQSASNPVAYTNSKRGTGASSNLKVSPDSSEDTSGRVYAVVASDPRLSNLPPSQWSVGQRVKFVLLRYQAQIVDFSVITLVVFTLSAFLVRVCRSARSSRSRNSTTSSSSSKSTNSSSKSFGSSTADYTSGSSQQNGAGHRSSAAAGQQLLSAGVDSGHTLMHQFGVAGGVPAKHAHQHHHNQPTISCSESCFSLDDYNICQSQSQQQQPQQQHAQQQRPPPLQVVAQLYHTHATNSSSSPNNSPALQSHHTTPPVSANEHLLPSAGQQQAAGDWTSTQAGRPKFWSFYGSEQHHSNSLRLNGSGGGGGANCGTNQQFANQQQQQNLTQQRQQMGAATMRLPQRTYTIGRNQPTLVRNFQCLQQQQQQQQSVIGGAHEQPMEPHQSDYLLAMAAVQQHQQQYQQPAQAAGGTWCASGANESGASETNGCGALQFVQLNATDLAAPPAATTTGAQQLTCAFHSQAQQQQQQIQLLFAAGQATPPAVGPSQAQPHPPAQTLLAPPPQ